MPRVLYIDFDLTSTIQHIQDWEGENGPDEETCKSLLKKGFRENIIQFIDQGDEINFVTNGTAKRVHWFLQKTLPEEYRKKIKVFSANSPNYIVRSYKVNVIAVEGIYKSNDITEHLFYDDNDDLCKEVSDHLDGLFKEHGKSLQVCKINPSCLNFLEVDKQIIKVPAEEYHRVNLSLYEAIEKNDIDKVTQLLQKPGVDVNYRGSKFAEINRYINIAASKGYIDILNLLLQNGAKIETFEYNWGGTPLYFALTNHEFDAAQFLISRGANFTYIYKSRHMYEVKYIIFCDEQVVVFLLKNALIEVNQPADDKNNSILHRFVVLQNNVDFAKTLITTYHANVNQCNYNKQTPLHSAAGESDSRLACVQLLIEHGANINCTDSSLRTPLHFAANQNCLEMVKYLVEKGADITLKDSYGNTACDLARHPIDLNDNDSDNDSGSSSYADAKPSNSEIVQFLSTHPASDASLLNTQTTSTQISAPSSEHATENNYQVLSESNYPTHSQLTFQNMESQGQMSQPLFNKEYTLLYQQYQDQRNEEMRQFQAKYRLLSQQHSQNMSDIDNIYQQELQKINSETATNHNIQTTTSPTRVPSHLQFDYSFQNNNHTAPSETPITNSSTTLPFFQ